MSQNDLNFLPLRVVHVGDGGRRSFDPVDKRQLVEACVQPGASLSGLALKAGVNANQLRKWVRLHQSSGTRVQEQVASGPSTFVPVIAIDAPAPLLRPAPERRPSSPSSRSAAPARLSAQLPNGVCGCETQTRHAQTDRVGSTARPASPDC
jgi:transposase